MEDNHVIVTDFGIATIDTEASHDELVEGINQKDTGRLECTPRYASPEQLTAQEIDGRSDLYSLAVTLYEMLTGSPPFTSKKLTTLVNQQVYARPKPLNQHCPDINPEFEHVIMRCLEKKPEKRYTDVDEVLEIIKNFTGIPRPVATARAIPSNGFLISCWPLKKVKAMPSGL